MRTLQSWFATPLGQMLAETERRALDRHLDRLTGWTLLQIGGFGEGGRVLRANTSRQWLVGSAADGPVDCRLRPEELPFQSDSMDIVVLVHSLEFSDNPHGVLREAERVLAPEGRLLVLTFNSISLWRMAQLVPGVKKRGAPWDGDYFTSRRVHDWLSLLGLEVDQAERLFFRPPLNRLRLQERLLRMERWGPKCLPWLGGVHLTVGRKRVAGLTPLMPPWRMRRRRLVGGLVQPTSRNIECKR